MISNYLDVIAVIYIVVIGVVLLAWHLTSRYTYWHELGVPEAAPGWRKKRPQVPPSTRVLGEMYDGLEGEEFGGFYEDGQPVCMLRDPRLVDQVLVNDFPHFHDRAEVTVDSLTSHLFNLAGRRRRRLRARLAPTFTASSMKAVAPSITLCVDQLINHLHRPAKFGEVLDVKNLVDKYCVDVVANSVYGIKLNSMKNPNSEFRIMVKKLFSSRSMIEKWMTSYLPGLSGYLNTVSTTEEATEFFARVFQEAVEKREMKNISRDDYLQLLVRMKTKGKMAEKQYDLGDGLDVSVEDPADEADEPLSAQALVFLTSGYRPTATTLLRCLQELAANPGLQTRLAKELETEDDEIPDVILLDHVIDECLRKYSPVSCLRRVCTKPWRVRGVCLDTGTRVVVPVHALHHDPLFYADPTSFRPERFDAERRDVFLPFGVGPRKCIGWRFARLQMKLALAAIISSYELRLSAETSPSDVISHGADRLSVHLRSSES